MKLKFLFSSIFVVFLFLVGSSTVFADCRIADNGWDPVTRNLQVCVGQFDSPAALRNTTATFNCLGNSNFPSASLCRDISNPTYDLTSTPDDQIAQDAGGKYYTCFTGISLNRAIGRMKVSFSGSQSCTTEEVVTRPADWNPLTEGLPWQEGNIPPSVGGNILCPDGISINTALGCISYDAVGGGFVRSLLTIAIGLGGGVALLLILYGVFIVTTSAGIPEKLKEGKELISSAVAGLLFIIMAIFLMNLVGIKILALPGLQ